ncbi:hypothetical protein GCM10010531_28150 [Blastococcus jejuensis]|uniref:DUF2202 domain-containing protein n=1 Tax=Blastococcus jejuensis TaxID=351224 RepID=A0ABP6PA58_9ACTN
MSTAFIRRAGVAALAVALLAGCSGTSPDDGDAVGTATATSSSAAGEETPEPSDGSGVPSAEVPAEVSAVPGATAAWSALMGPDGEYAAYAAYTAVIDEFGQVEPYVSIREAEARHAEALIRQLDRLGVEVPENPYLGQIAAPAALQTAAAAWADGEVANVALYDELLAQVTDDAALTRVFTNLRRASEEMHLPAFSAAADNGGVLTSEQMAELGLH